MIQWIISDCDGVLTDGRLYYDQEGEVLKVFNVKDGTAIKAIKALQSNKINTYSLQEIHNY